MKRQKRRKRYQLRKLDSIALKQIRNSYNLCANSWGGTRCPGCGINIRPYQLLGTDFSGTLVDEHGNWTGHISGYLLPCKKVKKCPGERDWL